MGLSFSKGSGPFRVSISKRGVTGSVGANGLRYTTSLSGKSTAKQTVSIDESVTFKDTNIRSLSFWVVAFIVCGVPSILAYFYLWKWLATMVYIIFGTAFLYMILGTIIYGKK